MAKISTKVLSIILAAMMLVSMVPMALAAESAPTLTDIQVGSEMGILLEEQEGTTYYYEIDDQNEDFIFKMEYTAGAEAEVTNNQGIKYQANSEGYYTLPIRQWDIAINYTIKISEGDNSTVYTLKVKRLYNDEAEIIDILGEGFSKTVAEKVWNIETLENQKELAFSPVLSLGAKFVSIVDELGKKVEVTNGVIKVTANTTLTAIVEDQRKSKQDTWTIKVLMDRGDDACELLGIDDAKKNGNSYVANTTNDKFLVNATVSEGATYVLYKDAAGTQEIKNKELTLTQKTTTVYIQVVASSGNAASVLIPLVINTTKVAAGEEAPVGELPYGGYPFFELRGGFPNGDSEKPMITVPLAKGTTTFKLDAKADLGSEIVLYGDENKITMVKNGATIKLDGGKTIMKAVVISRNGEEKEIEIVIDVPMVAAYKDKITSWAATYVNGLNNMGLGLLRGDEKGNFNGAKGLNRYEMAALMVRLSGTNKDFFAGFSTPFTDKIASWAVNYVKAAYKMELIAGIEVEGKLEYQGAKTATRNQFFRILMNVTMAQEGTDVDTFYAENKEAIDKFVAEKKLKDAEQVADWAKAGTYTAIYKGYIVGDDKGNINPEKTITRNEAAVLLYKVLGA